MLTSDSSAIVEQFGPRFLEPKYFIGPRQAADGESEKKAMIGLDILHLSRVAALLNRRASYARRFMQRILHPNERTGVPTTQSSLIRYLATR